MQMAASVAVIFAAAALVAGASEKPITDEATALIALTRETQATYSIVSANRLYREQGRVDHEWAAEFHDGVQHRVETPRDRLIADCAAKTGTYFSVESRKVFESPGVAGAACGVNANAKILAARTDGRRHTAFGPATRLIVTDDNAIRTYDIAPDGAILGATISARDGRIQLVSRAVYYKAKVPTGIFSVVSLAQSAVPEAWQKSASQ